MNIPLTDRCLNCERTEMETPLSRWRFQGREFVICSDCLPILIHKRAQLLTNWETASPAPTREPSQGQDLGM